MKDAKYGREEAPGIGQLVAGIAAAHADDEARLARGAALFDDLYAVHGRGDEALTAALGRKEDGDARTRDVRGGGGAARRLGDRPRAGARSAKTWDFQSDALNAPPAGFSFGRTGQGRAGRWVVVQDPTAPSGDHVLAQLDQDDTDYRFPVAVADAPAPEGPPARGPLQAGEREDRQACGLVFRFRDPDNYYVARANALEDNVNLYQRGEGTPPADPGLERQGRAERVARARDRGARRPAQGLLGRGADHRRRDETFGDAGKVGVWTKADSVTYFDALTAKPLG